MNYLEISPTEAPDFYIFLFDFMKYLVISDWIIIVALGIIIGLLIFKK